MTGPERVQRDTRVCHASPLPQIIVSHSRAAGSSSKRPSKQPPRPQNAWILYRQWALASLLQQEPELRGVPQSQLSKRLGAMWRKVNPEVRASFEHQANIMKEQHALEHPDYQFRPVKKSVKEREREERKQEKVRAKEAKLVKQQPKQTLRPAVPSLAHSGEHVASVAEDTSNLSLPPAVDPSVGTDQSLDGIEVCFDAGPSAASTNNTQSQPCDQMQLQVVNLLAPQELIIQPWPSDGAELQHPLADETGPTYGSDGAVQSMTPDFLSTNAMSSPTDSLPSLPALYSPNDVWSGGQFFENGMPTLTVADSFNDLCGLTFNDFDFSSNFGYGLGGLDSGVMQPGYSDLSRGCVTEASEDHNSAHSQFDPFSFVSDQF